MTKYIILFLSIIFSFAILIRGCESTSSNYISDESNIGASENINIQDYDTIHSVALNTSVELSDTINFSNEANITFISDNLEIPCIIDNRKEQILTREGYTCSYNQETRNANWVAWHLTKEHANGPWTKKGIPYIEDEDVKGYRQENSDWESIDLSDAGIDHGHICPAADNKWSKNAMVQSYLLTNMCPQNANLNRGIWENLESRCRGWARHYGEIFIVAGPIFYSNNYKTIGANKIGIPDAFYKVVLCLSKEPKALGFIFPNSDPIYSKIADYLLSVDQVEEITKIDFFHNLEDSIENIIEANSNLNKW